MLKLYETPEEQYEYVICRTTTSAVFPKIFKTQKQAQDYIDNKVENPDGWFVVKRSIGVWEEL